MAKKAKSPKRRTRPAARERRELRFEPRASTSTGLVYALGGLGAALMGAGAWEEFGWTVRDNLPDPIVSAPYILAAGAVLVGVSIWVGTSGEPPLRVGDGGVALERSGIKRIRWCDVERITIDAKAVRVVGKDDAGAPLTIAATLSAQPQAAAWIVKEARERVPQVVEVPEGAALAEVRASAGESLPLDPPQVVGKHCAASGKVIAYEPDARVCPRCERVYHKDHVPEACACGASLAELKAETKTD